MAQAQIGQYEVTLESRGLRLHQSEGRPPLPVRPLLTFNVTIPGQQPQWFQLARMHSPQPGVIEFHGSTSQSLSLNGKLSCKPDSDRLNVEIQVESASEDIELRLGAYLVLTGEADPRWMVPGFFYGDNKPKGCTRIYPAFSEINRDLRKMSSSYWAIRSDRASMPLICSWTYGCFSWITSEGVFGRTRELPRGVGMSGLYFGSEDGQPTLGFEYPYREAPAKFSFCHDDRTEPEDTYVLLPEGTPMRVSLSFGMEIPDVHGYGRVVRTIYNERKAEHPLRPKMPPEAAEHAAHRGLLRWHYDSRHASIFESATFDRHFGRKGQYSERSHMHAGWLSGGLPAFVLLSAGRESNHADSVTAGTAVFNKLTSQLSPAGTIFPVWTEEHGWSCSFGPEEGTAHSRTIAEAIIFTLKALGLEMRHDHAHHQWYEASISSLNYAMGAQREDGAFPAYYDLTTGRPTSFDGCGGLPWVAAMAMGATLLQKRHFREVAKRGGEYYGEMVRNELLCGTVEDQPMVPTVDDCHWALISFMALYEMDRDLRWLDLARRAADLAMTWRSSYNVSFGDSTILGRYDFRTRGGDISSVAAPVLGCAGLISYRELLKLSALTGDDYYRQRAEDSRAFVSQLVAREDGDLNARAGMAATQVFHTDWWQPKGIVLSLSGAMSCALIKYIELIQRAYRVPQTVQEAAKDEEYRKSVAVEPVMYSEVALQEDGFATQSGEHSVFSDMTSGLANALGIGGGEPRTPQGTPIPSAPGSQRLSGEMPRLSKEVPRSLTGAVGSILGIGDGGGRQPSASDADPSTPIPPSPANRPAEPAPRGRRFSGDQVQPPPPLVGPTPLPMAGMGQQPPADDDMPSTPPRGDGQDPQEVPPSSDDIEIKYKIF